MMDKIENSVAWMHPKGYPNATLNLVFPSVILTEPDVLTVEENDKLIERTFEIQKEVGSNTPAWLSGTYNTLGTYEPMMDECFQYAFIKIKHTLQKYLIGLGRDSEGVKVQGSWLNIYEDPKDYQEFHTHPDSIISGVYYVKSPEGAGKLRFENPAEPDMLPLPNNHANPLTDLFLDIEPPERSIILFRSYMRHAVAQGTNTEPRISLSFNCR